MHLCFGLQIANETVDNWFQLDNNNIVDIKEEFLTMTLKGITRTCYGSMFNNDEEFRKMYNIYQKVHIHLCTTKGNIYHSQPSYSTLHIMLTMLCIPVFKIYELFL